MSGAKIDLPTTAKSAEVFPLLHSNLNPLNVMKMNTLKIAGLSLVVAAIAAAPLQALAQEKKDKPAVEKPAGAKAEKAIPFHGKVTALDKSAKTVTVGERVFHVTAETRIVKLGKPATLEDGAVGEQVGGSYVKGDDGKLTARMVRFGPKPEGQGKPEGKPEPKGRAKKQAQ